MWPFMRTWVRPQREEGLKGGGGGVGGDVGGKEGEGGTKRRGPSSAVVSITAVLPYTKWDINCTPSTLRYALRVLVK